MTKTFSYKFTTYKKVLGALTTQDHEIRVTVTDGMEKRDSQKRDVACSRVSEILREKGYHHDISIWDLKEERR